MGQSGYLTWKHTGTRVLSCPWLSGLGRHLVHSRCSAHHCWANGWAGWEARLGEWAPMWYLRLEHMDSRIFGAPGRLPAPLPPALAWALVSFGTNV